MLQLEYFSLIPINELENADENTWLYVLHIRPQKLVHVPPPINITLPGLNSTINLKDNSQWLDNLSPGDILLQDVLVTETFSENDQTKIIDTRTFTRPRKNRFSPSLLQPISQRDESSQLNNTYKAGDTLNGADVLNATVIIDEPSTKIKLNTTSTVQGELNATFPVELNGPTEEELSPCNNNVYNLNSTFQTQPAASDRSYSVGPAPSKTVLNATYVEDEPVQGPITCLDELDELNEIEDEDRCDFNEDGFRKPLMRGAVPKRPLIRTSTWNYELTASPKKEITPPSSKITPPSSKITPPGANGLKDIEQMAKHQEDILAQTSTPMGQRRFTAFQRSTEVDHNLGSPIISLAEGIVNFGPPIPLRESIVGNANLDSTLDNSNNRTRGIQGHLTFDKSQNSVENQSDSPSSPASSPYSSQSLESETGVPATTQELIRRSMPNLNNQSRMRLPQPSSMAGNLNRQHGSDSGLRPPSMGGAVRPPVHNGSAFGLMRPQFKVPQPPPPVETAMKTTTHGTVTTTEPVRSSQMLQQPRSSGIAPPVRSSLLPNSTSKLKPLQLVAPRASGAALPVKAVVPAAKASSDELNSTVIMEKPSVVLPPAAPANSGIPRPSSMLSRIPMPRTMKSSIPMPAARPRAPHQ
ncbi:uncharacterized protein LOC124333641 isoform X2 [Daphnia pulicaria]|uniref:uncharacterized protein LOC124333641 isoform X2 n=1 Tax=Daphnia pulicaria TaxID=35523 RepID=UPI001EEC6177|nr:uncharacterized protein LOC124333641 isoform X2 [Daphnia pulicaria]